MQIEDLSGKNTISKNKRCFMSDSKVGVGNLTKALDFSAFEKFDFYILTKKIFP